MNACHSFLTFFLLAMGVTAVGEDRPNIIMFLIDDQNSSSIAAFGGDTYTPNLDRMAKEGMKFTRAYVSSSVCTSGATPARKALNSSSLAILFR